MGQGGTLVQRIDIIDIFDPRVDGRAADKGTLFRYIPAVGDPVVLIKQDSGFSTNWIDASGSSGVYTASSLGAGNAVYAGTVANDFQFKSLVAGAGISITNTATEITIANTGGGTVTGDPNTVAYFDAAGNLNDNLDARFDGTINAMALLNTPGTITLSGLSALICSRGDTSETVTASGIAASIHGAFLTGATATASSTGSLVRGFSSTTGSMTAGTGAGASVFGSATNAGTLTATAAGAKASGSASNSGSISAATIGSHAMGAVNASAQIVAGSGGTYGSLAFGGLSDSALISSTGSGSVAHGGGANAGSQIVANNDGSHAHGVVSNAGKVRATGLASHAHGNANTYEILASGRGAFAGGTALGANMTASSEAAFAYGEGHNVSGDYAQALGLGQNNSSYAALLIGRFGITTGATTNAWVATDPLFVAGNGTGVGTEASAYTLDKDGKITTTAAERNLAQALTAVDTTLSARSDRVLFVNTSGVGANITITLPAGENGLEFWIKDSGGNASVRNVLIAATGGDVVEASANITNDRGARHLQYFAGTWYILNLP